MRKISAFVISYNRADVLGTCLRALRFADELIVVDKSSTDESRIVALAHADHVLTVPWTPTVEQTRALALSLCQYEWVLFQDDDEILSVEAESAILAAVEATEIDIYAFPLRHYILGRHDERSYYWPEYHVRLFRRGAVTFTQTVHAGITHHSDRMSRFTDEGEVCIHHLSNPNVSGWIEKTNRYTSNLNRVGMKPGPQGLAVFAHERIDYWMARTKDASPDGYPAAASLLRALYDLVDGLKVWEADSGSDGAVLLRQVCDKLETKWKIHQAGAKMVRQRCGQSTLK